MHLIFNSKQFNRNTKHRSKNLIFPFSSCFNPFYIRREMSTSPFWKYDFSHWWTFIFAYVYLVNIFSPIWIWWIRTSKFCYVKNFNHICVSQTKFLIHNLYFLCRFGCVSQLSPPQTLVLWDVDYIIFIRLGLRFYRKYFW